jgi:sulfur carrier protein
MAFFRFDSTLISVSVNGEERQFESPLTCAGLVAEMGLAGKRVAVECNGEIVPRSALVTRTIANGDKIEIVVAVGGG